MKDWPSGTTKNCPAEPAAVPRPSAQERLSSGIRRAKAASTMAKDAPATPTPTSTPADSVSRSEEHTSELQSLMRISYAVFCLKKKKYNHALSYRITHE